MNELETIIRESRFVTISHQKGRITVEANCWLGEPSTEPYTVNLRGSGETLEEASKATLHKIESIRRNND